MRIVLVVVAAAAIVWGLTRQAPYGAPRPDRADVVAVVGGVEITRAEVRDANADQFLQIERQMHELWEQGVEQAIDRRLVELEAEARGLSVDELLDQEVSAVVEEPTDEEVDAFYEARKGQLRAPKEELAPRIRDFLKQREARTAYQVLVTSLRERYPVENRLEPQRVLVDAIGPAKGPDDAPITLVEFSDFECPFCKRVLPTLEQVLNTYGDQVRLVYRQFPLTSLHRNAQKAAEASLCAHEQGSFWEMHDAMFADQSALGVDDLRETARSLGLDGVQFDACLDSEKYAARVEEDLRAGMEVGVRGTPALFINGRFLVGAQPYQVVSRFIDDELRRLSE